MNQDGENYTRETSDWLNQRFDLFDSDGVYVPNQPAYGFSPLAFRLEEYARMYAVLRVLNRLPFTKLLDLGCADGFGPGIVKHLFGATVFGLDLSYRAMIRSRELFAVNGAASDAHELPFPDDEFDVSICTEVLEHVVDPARVIAELCRVSRSFVVVSTPRAPSKTAQQNHFKNLDPQEPHAHIHYFTDSDMSELVSSNAWLAGARTRFVNSIFDRFAWADRSSLNQRKSYLEFTVNSADLGTDQQQTMRHMLIDRYIQKNTVKKRLVTPFSVGALLRLDGALAAWWPKVALDHLVVIPVNSDAKWILSRIPQRRIISELLGGYSVSPLKNKENTL